MLSSGAVVVGGADVDDPVAPGSRATFVGSSPHEVKANAVERMRSTAVRRLDSTSRSLRNDASTGSVATRFAVTDQAGVSWLSGPKSPMVRIMEASTVSERELRPLRDHMPSHVPSGAVLLALELGEEAHGICGLDVLRRSVDRAPPVMP
jgi:hypothetical protein